MFSSTLKLLLIMAISLAVEPVDLLGVVETPVGSGLPAGWKVKPVRGQSAPATEVQSIDGANVLRVEGKSSAAWFHRELPSPIAETAGSLSWSWRVLESPAGANLRRKETDDSPMRVFVVFGKPSIFGRSGRVIFYSYGGQDPAGYERRSQVSDRAHVVRRDGRSDNGKWLDNAVDPFADYRRVWRGSPPAITAVGIMQDTDQTKAKSVAQLRRLDWIPSNALPR